MSGKSEKTSQERRSELLHIMDQAGGLAPGRSREVAKETGLIFRETLRHGDSSNQTEPVHLGRY